MKLTEYIEHYKKQGWDDEAEKEWRELQEKAKEWDKATTLDSYEEFLIQKEIVERLKVFFNGDNVLTKSEYKQKILGEEK